MRTLISVSMKKAYLFSVSLLGVLMLVGCASSPYQALSEQPSETAQDYDYLIGPGDQVEIFVWGNPELTATVPVRPDGKITTRLVEDIAASGKTPTQLARDIEEAYSQYVKNAVVSVLVSGFAGVPSQRIRVVGEAAKPQSIAFRKHLTLLDLIIMVGGLTEFADGNSAVLVRNQGDEKKVYNVRLDDLVREGDISANVALLPGDVVIIPEAWF
ncbi:MAG: XrtA/PEP-CTERM system exopolysaccharide export protein [Sedimenticola sp.]